MTFIDAPGDTPLRDVPDGYALGGRGRWLVLGDGPDAGRRLWFTERRLGAGPPGGASGPAVLLVHGNPECSFTFRQIVAALARRPLPAGTRIVAPDHLGFGRSDQASHAMAEPDHAENLAQLVTALDLRDVVLVVHDWGGPIGIGALLREPERVTGLVVLNTTVFPMPEEGPTFDRWPVPVVAPWSATPDRVPDRMWGLLAAFAAGVTPTGAVGLLARQAAFVTRAAGGAALPGPDPELARVIHDQFRSRANVRSSKDLVRRTATWGHGTALGDPARDTRPFYRWLQERLPAAWGPDGAGVRAAGVFGAWDPLAKRAVLDQWRAALPQLEGRIDVHPGVSHFVQHHRPEQIADAIAGVLAPAG